MAGSLVLISEATASTSASITLTGIDSTYDVYMLTAVGIEPDTDNTFTKLRVTKSGSPDTTSNYDLAYYILRTDTSFSTNDEENEAEAYINHSLGTGTSEFGNFTIYLFNFNSSSEYSFGTVETCDVRYDAKLMSRTGGFVHTVASASDGVQLYMSSGNIESGEFKLYGLKK